MKVEVLNLLLDHLSYAWLYVGGRAVLCGTV
jgi:hypothetical protein